MSRCHYIWAVILIFAGCAIFTRPSEFQRGLGFYKKKDFETAAKHFNLYANKSPKFDSVLYYLYDCYQRLNQTENSIKVLEKLVSFDSKDENVYLNLFYHYRKNGQCHNLYNLLVNLKPQIKEQFKHQLVLTRRLYAEIITGVTDNSFNPDPVGYARSKGYLSSFPDGKFYEYDTITNGNLIILLDQLLEPGYPPKFLSMKNISSHSFLYLPYMRLTALGILEFIPDLEPDENASVTTAAEAIANLKKKNLLK